MANSIHDGARINDGAKRNDIQRQADMGAFDAARNGTGKQGDPGSKVIDNNHQGVVDGKNNASANGTLGDPGSKVMDNNHQGVLDGKNAGSSVKYPTPDDLNQQGQNKTGKSGGKTENANEGDTKQLIEELRKAHESGDAEKEKKLQEQLKTLGVQMPR